MEIEPPLFVFVTAYSDYALKAFDTHAIDYLMKPVEEDRLAATLDRARQRLSEKRATEEATRLKEVLAEIAPEAELPEAAEAHSSNRYEKLINRSEEHTSELQSLMRISYAVFCLKKKKKKIITITAFYTANQQLPQ